MWRAKSKVTKGKWVRGNTRGHICRRCFGSCRGRAWGSPSGAWLQCRRQHQMTRHQTIWMKVCPSTEMMAVTAWPLIKWLFIETNTPLSANATNASTCSVQLGISSPNEGSHSAPSLKISLCWELNKGFVQWTQDGSTCARLRTQWIFLTLVYLIIMFCVTINLIFYFNYFSKIVSLFTQVYFYKLTFTSTQVVLKRLTSTQVQNNV